jgi:fumarylacetoacetate (FAA) hydrolase
MDWSFGELLAHLAYNRNLRPGTILGSGTVSNREARTVGSACLAEQRALETMEKGQPVTPWLRYGERMRFEVLDTEGRSVFGAIDHRFVGLDPVRRREAAVLGTRPQCSQDQDRGQRGKQWV